jgi:hypothetical protein
VLCRLILSILEFKRQGRFVNLSRVDPGQLSHAQYGTGDYLNISGVGDTNAIALSMIIVKKCALYRISRDDDEKTRKEIHGHFHTQELRRMMGVLGLVYGRRNFIPGVFKTAVQFTTIPLAHSTPNTHSTRNTGMYFIFAYTSLNLGLWMKQRRYLLRSGKALSKTVLANRILGLRQDTKESKAPWITVSDFFLMHRNKSEFGNSWNL